MSLTLYYHPLASFCHKVLIALYEHQTTFEGKIVDLADERSSAELLEFWPVGKIPVLRDSSRDRTVPETSIIVEYLTRHYPGPQVLLPSDFEAALSVRLWDRFFDLYIGGPMQKIVTDRLRPSGRNDPEGVEQAKQALRQAYSVAERQLENRTWVAGDDFSMADCAAAPVLFYADIVLPFSADFPNTKAYFERLIERPSFARVLRETRPYFRLFPMNDQIPGRFLDGTP
jgi:glutathione S-transferase